MKIKVYQINEQRDINHLNGKDLQNQNDSSTVKVDSSIYDEVFSGEVECGNLEEVYRLFNGNSPYTHRGRDMGISDVVSVSDAPELVGRIRFYNSSELYEEIFYTDIEEYKKEIEDAEYVGRTITTESYIGKHIPSVKDGIYFCTADTFAPIEFEENNAQKPDNLLRVVMIEPGKKPYEAEICNNLDGLRHAVGGMIEITYPFYDEDQTIVISNEESKLIGMEGNRKIFKELYAGPIIIAGDDGAGNERSLTDEQVDKYLEKFKEIEEYTEQDVEDSIYYDIRLL